MSLSRWRFFDASSVSPELADGMSTEYKLRNDLNSSASLTASTNDGEIGILFAQEQSMCFAMT